MKKWIGVSFKSWDLYHTNLYRKRIKLFGLWTPFILIKIRAKGLHLGNGIFQA